MIGKLIAALASLPCFALSIFVYVFTWTGPCHNPTGLSMFQMTGIPLSEKAGMGAMIVVPALTGVFMLTLARRLGTR